MTDLCTGDAVCFLKRKIRLLQRVLDKLYIIKELWSRRELSVLSCMYSRVSFYDGVAFSNIWL